MKKLSTSIILLLGILIVAAPASASWVNLGGKDGAVVSLVESTPDRIVLELRVNGFEQTDVVIDGDTYARITMPSQGLHLEQGFPELPLVARSVIIPEDREMELRVISADFMPLSGIVPVPSKGNLLRTVDPETVPYEFGEFYTSSGTFPPEDAFTREPYILRDFRGLTVVFNPIRYTPSTGTLDVCTNMLVELTAAGPARINALERSSALESVMPEFAEIYSQRFLNYGMTTRYQLVSEVGKMLIVCFDGFEDTMQPLVEWRNQMGIPTELVLKSQIGSTAAQIKAYIQSLYDQSTDPRLGFVLLVGDAPQIPPIYVGSVASDPSYSLLAGGDNYPDIFVGRFSAENVSHVQTQVLRTVNYEKHPLLSGEEWYPKGTGIASTEGPGHGGLYDNQHVDLIRSHLMAYGYTHIDQFYGYGATAAQVTAALNNGRSIINYTGHGSTTSWSTTGFSNTHINALQNTHMLPIICSVACVNGNFPSTTCFAETWLRATHNGQPTGAVGTYMSTINQSWNPPMAGQIEFNRLIYQDIARTYGSICFNGSCYMMDFYGSSGASEFRAWTVFGDPALRYRNKPPVPMTVLREDFIDPGASTYEMQVPGVAGALCALSFNGVLIGSAFTDANGNAVIEISSELPEGEEIDLVVTGYNKIPYINTVLVDYELLPAAMYNGEVFEVTLPGMSIEHETLTISNVGDPGSVLEFDLSFFTMFPGLEPWFTFEPASGSIPHGESVDVVLTFSSYGMNDGVYTGRLRCAYNPDQGDNIQIRMTVFESTSAPDRGDSPSSVRLEAAQPNPFSGSTTLRFGLPEAGNVTVAVYDATGRHLRVLTEGSMPAGMHQISWDGLDASGHSVATGVYFARLTAGDTTESVRLLRVR